MGHLLLFLSNVFLFFLFFPYSFSFRSISSPPVFANETSLPQIARDSRPPGHYVGLRRPGMIPRPLARPEYLPSNMIVLPSDSLIPCQIFLPPPPSEVSLPLRSFSLFFGALRRPAVLLLSMSLQLRTFLPRPRSSSDAIFFLKFSNPVPSFQRPSSREIFFWSSGKSPPFPSAVLLFVKTPFRSFFSFHQVFSFQPYDRA